MNFSSSQARRLLPIPPGPVIETSLVLRSRPVVAMRSLRSRSSSSRPPNGGPGGLGRPPPPPGAPPPRLEAGAQGPDAVDEVQGGANAPLRIILARRRSAPDCHDRVADELLDGPAVAADDVRRDVEVAGPGGGAAALASGVAHSPQKASPGS